MSETESSQIVQAYRLYRTPPCCAHPLPLTRLKAGREERQKRKRGKGGMGSLLSFKVKKNYRSKKFSRHCLKKKREREIGGLSDRHGKSR